MKAYIKSFNRWFRLDDVVYHILRNRPDMAERMLEQEIGSIGVDYDDVTFYINANDFRALELTKTTHIIEKFGKIEVEDQPKFR